MTDGRRITRLTERNARINEELRVLHKEKQANKELIDQLRLKERPTYPTDRQRAAIKIAVQKIREGVPAKSVHGDPVDLGDGRYWGVVWDGERKYIHLDPDAPPEEVRYRRLWFFSPEEVEELLGLILDEGIPIAGWWRGGEGISVILEGGRLPALRFKPGTKEMT